MANKKRKIFLWMMKGAKSLLALFVAISVVLISPVSVSADTLTKTVTSPNGNIRVKANAAGQGYQIEVKDSLGVYQRQHYGAAITSDEATSNSNGSVVYFKAAGHEYLVGNKYYFSALTETGEKTTTMFNFTDNSISGSTISTTYNSAVPVYNSANIINVKLVQKLTVTDTHVKKDFDVSFTSPVEDMRLLHGGDTYFGGKDSGFPSYSPLNNSVYIVPLLSGTDKDLNAGIMQFSGDTETPASNYFAGQYSIGKTEVQKGQLSNYSTPITSTAAVDGGYYLQWNRGNGMSMSVLSTERFIAESGAVQVLAPSTINAIFNSQYSADFTAFNIGNSAVTISLKATSPATTTKIYDGNTEVSSFTLQANQTKDISVRGIAGGTPNTGVIKLVATYTYSGSSKSYTAQADFVTKDGPSIRNVAITNQQKDTLEYTVETNLVDAVAVKMFDGATGALVPGWSDDYTPTELTTTRTASISTLTPGKTYYLQVTIAGNLTPNRAATFIKWSDVAPTGLASVATKGPDLNNGKITNVTTDMEYRKEGTSVYTKVTGTEITGLTSGNYFVRYRDTTKEANGWHMQSADVSIVVKDTTFNVTQGSISNGIWSGDSSVSIIDTKSGTLTFIPTSGYELKATDVTFTGSGTISVDNMTNTITISNVKSAGTISSVCSQTEESINKAIVNTEIAKLKSDITLDILQAINTDLYTKIYESGKSKNPDVTYTFKNTTYTNSNLVSALNNSATEQTVVLEVTLTKGTISKTKEINVVFPKENIAPFVVSIKTRVLNDGLVSTILNNLTFGIFYNEEIEVTIEGQDDNSGIKNISYQLVSSNNPGTAVPDPDKEWITIDNNPAVFTIAPSFKGVIFTKAEDIAGNVSINSYSKKGAVITENGLPIVSYDPKLSATQIETFVNEKQNLTTLIEDKGTTSNLKSTEYKVFTDNDGIWEELSDKSKSATYLFDDNKILETYDTLLDKSGRYKVSANGADFSGNINLLSYGYINIDVDNPTIAVTTSMPITWVNQHTITIDLSDNSAVTNSGLYQLSLIKDSEEPLLLKTFADNTYQESDYTYEVDSEGSHTYVFKVSDKAGNTISSSSYTVKLDKTAPAFPKITKDETNGKNDKDITWYKGVKPKITLFPTVAEVDSSDNVSNYQLNDGTKDVFDTTLELSSSLLEGKNIIQVSAYDKAGNIASDGTNQYLEDVVYVDTQIASVDTISLNGTEIANNDTGYGKNSGDINIKSSDQTSGVSHIEFALCEGLNSMPQQSDWVEKAVGKDGSVDFSIEDGEWTLFVKAFDKAGNDASETKVAKIVLDQTKPVINGVENGEVYYTDQVFEIEEINLDKVEINGIVSSDYTIQASQTKQQEHVINAYDKAGNMTEYKIITKPINLLMLPLAGVNESNVRKSHQKVCEEIEKQLLAIDQKNASSEQIEIIEKSMNEVATLLLKIKKVQEEVQEIVSQIPNKPNTSASIKDEEALNDAELRIDDLLEKTNLDDEERIELEAEKDKILKMKDHILALKTFSTQKELFDQQEIVNAEELLKFEEAVKNTMDISTVVGNTSKEKINVKHLIAALTPEDILNYEGQAVEITILMKDVASPYVDILDGYKRVKSYDFSVHKKIGEKEEQIVQLVQPIEITIDINKDKDTEYIMLRHHQGSTEKLADLSTTSNQVIIKTTKFSTYELLKQNKAITTIGTGDNTDYMGWVGLIFLAIAGASLVLISKRKKETN